MFKKIICCAVLSISIKANQIEIAEEVVRSANNEMIACSKSYDDILPHADFLLTSKVFDYISNATSRNNLNHFLETLDTSKLSERGKERLSVYLSYKQFLYTLNSTKNLQNELIILRSLLKEMRDGTTVYNPDLLISIVNSVVKKIDNNKRAKVNLALFTEKFLREMERSYFHEHAHDLAFRAKWRPVVFGAIGTGGFIAAMEMAAPVFAAATALAGENVGLVSLAQVGTTGTVAAVGSVGLEMVIDIAVRMYFEAWSESTAKNIPLACSLIKQREIGKAMDLQMISHAGMHGAVIGAALAGGTITIAKTIEGLGLGLMGLPFARAQYTGSSLLYKSMFVDEAALISVVGLVGIGGAFEVKEAWESGHQAFTYGDLENEIENSIKTYGNDDKKLKKLSALKNQVRSLKIQAGGEVVSHSLNAMVCGLLLYHFAHGDFMEAWNDQLEGVIRGMATSADDVPPAVQSTLMAAKKAMAAGTKSSAISIKISLLKGKLGAIASGSNEILEDQIDHIVHMKNSDLEENIKSIESQISNLK